MDGNGVDPTLHYRDGHWYVFVNIAESGGSTSDELFLFVSEQLTGPFRPHPGNPIASDVRHARPAGRLFEHQGRLIRPSRDRSEEHTSELQSLMRISYAVFCLKKKTIIYSHTLSTSLPPYQSLQPSYISYMSVLQSLFVFNI